MQRVGEFAGRASRSPGAQEGMTCVAPVLLGLTPQAPPATWEIVEGQRLNSPGGCVAHVLIFKWDYTHCPGSSVGWTWPQKPASRHLRLLQ